MQRPQRVSHDFMHPSKFSNVSVSITSYDSAWISSVVSKRRPFSHNFILGNRKKIAGGGVVRRMGVRGDHCNIFGSQELSNNDWCVSGRVTVEKPVVLPLLWTFALNVLPQSLQNLTVELAIDGNLSPRTGFDCYLKTQQRNITSGKLHAICKTKSKLSLCPKWKSERIFLFKLPYRAQSLYGTRQVLNCSRNLLFHAIQKFPAAFTVTCFRSLYRIS